MSSDGDMEYAGELTDDEPQTFASYANVWRSFLLGVVQLLREPDVWLPGTDMVAVTVQVDDLLVRLIETENVMAYDYPVSYWTPFQAAWFNLGADRMVAGYVTGQQLGVAYYQPVSANGDEFLFFVNHAAGVNYLTLHGIKASNLGKTEIYVNGSLVSGSLFDWYAAAQTINQQQHIQITFAEDMRQEIKIKVNGKNAASSAYFVWLTSLAIEPNHA